MKNTLAISAQQASTLQRSTCTACATRRRPACAYLVFFAVANPAAELVDVHPVCCQKQRRDVLAVGIVARVLAVVKAFAPLVVLLSHADDAVQRRAVEVVEVDSVVLTVGVDTLL